jgi:hypothetical protein
MTSKKVLTTYYVTDGTLPFGERHDDYDKKEQIKQKWNVVDTSNSMMCGNVKVIFDDNNIASLSDNYDTKQIQSCKQISSALALYRTISLFECGLNSKKVDFYKMNWKVMLEHKETRISLNLGEWKGAFQIFTPYTELGDVNSKYKEDVEELLTLLVSPTMTIGYDGTIAGTVA